MKKNLVKNILFRTKFKGYGIVNFDSNAQKYIYLGTDEQERMYTQFTNVSYAKKTFNKTGSKLNSNVKISNDCLLYHLFSDCYVSQNPGVLHDEYLLINYIASPSAILRGYTLLQQNTSYTRTSPIRISPACLINDAIPTIEAFSRSGEKKTDKDKADNSFFFKETIGNTEYSTSGEINLKQLQFVSGDPIFDRKAFNPDKFNPANADYSYLSIMQQRMPEFNSNIGYFIMKTADDKTPEIGYKNSNDNLLFLVKYFFKKLLSFRISKRDAFLQTTELEYKLVYDVFEDTEFNEDGWITINSIKDIENINFDSEEFYIAAEENSKQLRQNIEKNYNEKIEIQKQKNQEKKDTKNKKQNINVVSNEVNAMEINN